jgi:hypothetical protein
LLRLLRAKADVDSITTRAAASALFTANARPIVLATDEALTDHNNSPLLDEARHFVRTGGTVIFCCHFSGFAQRDDADKLFAAFGLDWEFGDYHRTEHTVNAAVNRIDPSGLVSRYSQKAVHLRHVDQRDAIYLPTITSHIQSRVFPPSPIEDTTQTPAALTSCGRGKLGYQGDVNGEEETTHVLLAMCGFR